MSKAYDLTSGINSAGNVKTTQVYTSDSTALPAGGGGIYPGSSHMYPGAGSDPLWSPGTQEQPVRVIKVDDEHLADLVEMLELEESATGLCLELNNKKYSLVDILHAQMKFMYRMNILLIHRQLGRANAED